MQSSRRQLEFDQVDITDVKRVVEAIQFYFANSPQSDFREFAAKTLALPHQISVQSPLQIYANLLQDLQRIHTNGMARISRLTTTARAVYDILLLELEKFSCYEITRIKSPDPLNPKEPPDLELQQHLDHQLSKFLRLVFPEKYAQYEKLEIIWKEEEDKRQAERQRRQAEAEAERERHREKVTKAEKLPPFSYKDIKKKEGGKGKEKVDYRYEDEIAAREAQQAEQKRLYDEREAARLELIKHIKAIKEAVDAEKISLTLKEDSFTTTMLGQPLITIHAEPEDQPEVRPEDQLKVRNDKGKDKVKEKSPKDEQVKQVKRELADKPSSSRPVLERKPKRSPAQSLQESAAKENSLTHKKHRFFSLFFKRSSPKKQAHVTPPLRSSGPIQ